MTRHPLAMLSAVAVLLLASPAIAQKQYGPGATDTEIKIGNINPYSGPASAYGMIGRTIAAYFGKVNAEGGVNGRPANVHRAPAFVWVGDKGPVVRCLPEFLLCGLRPVGVPDLQAIAFLPQILLHDPEPLGHARPHQGRRAGRIQRPMGDVVRARVTQIDQDRFVDTFDINELTRILAFAERQARKEKYLQHNVPENLSEDHA